MKLKIERPDWVELFTKARAGGGNSMHPYMDWFDEHVEPINSILADATEVYLRNNSIPAEWHNVKSEGNQSHKAFLIGTEPIVKETAEDVLRDIVNDCSEHAAGFTATIRIEDIERAKAVLENK